MEGKMRLSLLTMQFVATLGIWHSVWCSFSWLVSLSFRSVNKGLGISSLLFFHPSSFPYCQPNTRGNQPNYCIRQNVLKSKQNTPPRNVCSRHKRHVVHSMAEHTCGTLTLWRGMNMEQVLEHEKEHELRKWKQRRNGELLDKAGEGEITEGPQSTTAIILIWV